MPGPAVERFVATIDPLVARADRRLEPLGQGPDLVASFTRIEAATRHRVWNMQRRVSLGLLRPTLPLDAETRDRGIEQRMIWERTAGQLPLLSSLDPKARYGNVARPFIVVDERYAIISGPVGSVSPLEAFGTDDAEVVRLAVAAFLETWDRSVTWDEAGLLPPLPPRRLAVAVGLVDGHTDAEIATELGISPRTVSSEVRAVVDWLGARNRTHAVAMLVGAA